MYIKPQQISLIKQLLFIKKLYPHWQSKIINSQLICVGNIKPTELSQSYKITITYKLKNSPKIKIINPSLEKNSKDEKPPHLYKGDFLCLYHPKTSEWNNDKKIAEYIVPWISLWLYYYEVWLSTDKWFGGGLHPNR